MTYRRDRLLDALLAVLVLVSLVLSSRVWTDPTRYTSIPSDRPRVQSQPYVPEWTMPDIYRPEQVMVQLPDGRGTYGGPDSALYFQVWRQAKLVLQRLQPIGLPRPVPEAELEPWREGPMITLFLPVSQPLSEWADLWGWTVFGLRAEADFMVDRVYLFPKATGGVIFGGPAGRWRMINLTEPDLARFQEIIEGIEVQYLHAFEPLPTDRAVQEVQAPDPRFAPLLEMTAAQPDRAAVLSRFFPDLSVVRQIEEKRQNSDDLDQNATSYTDGQKLVRIYHYGAIEFYAPDRTVGTSPPTLSQALAMAEEFVTAHGGWPQEIVLTNWETLGNRITLTFDYRKGVSGALPTFSRHGFLKVEVAQDKVVYLFREPSPRLVPSGSNQALIDVQEALRHLAEEKLWTRYEKVRDAYVVYLFHSGHQRQVVEPYWVIHLTWGEPYYVNALAYTATGERVLPETRTGP